MGGERLSDDAGDADPCHTRGRDDRQRMAAGGRATAERRLDRDARIGSKSDGQRCGVAKILACPTLSARSAPG